MTVDNRPLGHHVAWAAKAAALCFAGWGVLHIWVGLMLLAGPLSRGLGQGRLTASAMMYYSFVVVLGVLVTAVAVRLNWRNDAGGYWINGFVVASTDLIFIAVMMAPGYITFSQGVSGPALAVPAIVLGGIARWSSASTPVTTASR